MTAITSLAIDSANPVTVERSLKAPPDEDDRRARTDRVDGDLASISGSDGVVLKGIDGVHN
ncbi:hypothetical protein [Nocardia panacis]|uniref:hypothetical protein n=1 Tax=Nocardia panacis TaxID=2340916 RepID=UPI00193997D8|nr:hypothetical protein [Nocardia panacis]